MQCIKRNDEKQTKDNHSGDKTKKNQAQEKKSIAR